MNWKEVVNVIAKRLNNPESKTEWERRQRPRATASATSRRATPDATSINQHLQSGRHWNSLTAVTALTVLGPATWKEELAMVWVTSSP